MSHDHSWLGAWVISSGRVWTGWARWSRSPADGLSPGQEAVHSAGRAQVLTFVPRPAQAYVVPTTAANAGRAFVAFARCPEDRAAHTVFFERRGWPRLHKALFLRAKSRASLSILIFSGRAWSGLRPRLGSMLWRRVLPLAGAAGSSARNKDPDAAAARRSRRRASRLRISLM